jgi:putative zinc finger/helix-turn-helix YgiT family protein
VEEETMKCRECRAADLVVSRENYRYVESGLPAVTLVGVDVRRCPNCGFQSVVIPRIEELHRKLARIIATHVAKLSKVEIRFLRKYLGYDRPLFAKVMGVDEGTVAHWETGRPMGATADRLLRVLVMREAPIDEYPNDRLADVAQEEASPILRMRPRGNSWEEATSA